jgi:glycine cleavage system H protein
VFVDLPEVGAVLNKGDAFGSVESVKAASSVYAPVSGKVVAVNQAVKDDNSIVNKSADKDGWMIQVKLSKPAELDSLLDRAAYDKLLAEAKH